jgi:predicted RNA-binding protein YlqC (UPF0109 family)
MMEMKTPELVTAMAKALVLHPEYVRVDAHTDGTATTLRLSVAPIDVGAVIGRHGLTAHSMRALLQGIGMREGHRYSLDIVEQR